MRGRSSWQRFCIPTTYASAAVHSGSQSRAAVPRERRRALPPRPIGLPSRRAIPSALRCCDAKQRPLDTNTGSGRALLAQAAAGPRAGQRGCPSIPGLSISRRGRGTSADPARPPRRVEACPSRTRSWRQGCPFRRLRNARPRKHPTGGRHRTPFALRIAPAGAVGPRAVSRSRRTRHHVPHRKLTGGMYVPPPAGHVRRRRSRHGVRAVRDYLRLRRPARLGPEAAGRDDRQHGGGGPRAGGGGLPDRAAARAERARQPRAGRRPAAAPLRRRGPGRPGAAGAAGLGAARGAAQRDGVRRGPI